MATVNSPPQSAMKNPGFWKPYLPHMKKLSPERILCSVYAEKEKELDQFKLNNCFITVTDLKNVFMIGMGKSIVWNSFFDFAFADFLVFTQRAHGVEGHKFEKAAECSLEFPGVHEFPTEQP